MPIVDGNYYARRKAIAVSHAHVGSALADFPLCVRISADADLGAVCQATGDDLRFTDASGNLLYAEKESFAVASGAVTGVFWVKVSTISAAADTTIYCYYGCGSASAQSGSTNVWDANYLGVWHLNQTGGVSTWLDSTSNGNHLTNGNATASVAGAIDGGAGFNGSNQYARRSALIASGDFTVSAWFNSTSLSGVEGILTQAVDAGTEIGLRLSGSGYQCYVDGTNAITSGTVLSVNTWYFAALTYAASASPKTALYHGGAAIATQNNAANYTRVYDYLGARTADTGLFAGTIDEARLSGIARSADWINFEYYNQKDAAGQLTWAAEEKFFSAGLFIALCP